MVSAPLESSSPPLAHGRCPSEALCPLAVSFAPSILYKHRARRGESNIPLNPHPFSSPYPTTRIPPIPLPKSCIA